MSTLALVRHGQASFFSDNYDQLSPLGQQQAQLLGEYWVKRNVHFDSVFSGPRVRQIETAALAGEVVARAGLPWPEPQRLPELDEHHVDQLIKLKMPEIAGAFPQVGAMHAAYVAAETPRDKHRTFQLMFEQMVQLWLEGRIEAPGVESWRAFHDRVRSGVQRITESQLRGRNVVAFTSVGAVTVSLQMALGCADRTAFDLGWRLRNASITDFVFSRQRMTLEGFNAFPHLEDPALWTYR